MDSADGREHRRDDAGLDVRRAVPAVAACWAALAAVLAGCSPGVGVPAPVTSPPAVQVSPGKPSAPAVPNPVPPSRRVGPEHDLSVDGFSPLLVGDAHHCAVRDRRVGVQSRLHLDGIDIEAAGDDHVLLAIDNIKKAAIVEAADIARFPEAR